MDHRPSLLVESTDITVPSLLVLHCEILRTSVVMRGHSHSYHAILMRCRECLLVLLSFFRGRLLSDTFQVQQPHRVSYPEDLGTSTELGLMLFTFLRRGFLDFRKQK